MSGPSGRATSPGGAYGTAVLSALSNLGKMFPALCYRRQAHWRERLAVAIGMWPRGEVGAGVLVLSLSYSIGGPIVTVAMLSLALNLSLTGVFIFVVGPDEPCLKIRFGFDGGKDRIDNHDPVTSVSLDELCAGPGPGAERIEAVGLVSERAAGYDRIGIAGRSDPCCDADDRKRRSSRARQHNAPRPAPARLERHHPAAGFAVGAHSRFDAVPHLRRRLEQLEALSVEPAQRRLDLGVVSAVGSVTHRPTPADSESSQDRDEWCS